MSFFNKNNKKRVKLILAGFALLFVVFINILAPLSKASAQSTTDYQHLFAGSILKATNVTDTTADIQIRITTSSTDNYDFVSDDGDDPNSFYLIAKNNATNYDYEAPINVNTNATNSNITTALTGLKKGTNYAVGIYYRSDSNGEGGGVNAAGSTKNDYYLISQTNFVALGDTSSGGFNPSTIQNGDNTDNAPKAVASGSTGLPTCSLGILPGESMNLAGCFAQGIYWAFFVPTSFIFSLSGQLLDWTMDYSLDSNSYNSTSFVAEGWKITRDLSNILFIFILLYTAIGTILGISGVNAKQTIIKIVIVALFINFSLFFSQIVIDAGNIVGRIFYESMGVKKSDSLVTNAFQSEDTKSISVAVVSQFNPQNLFKEANSLNLNTPGGVEDQDKPTGTQPGQFAIISLIMSAINLVGAYIFFVVGFLFIGRVVGLWLAMIMAPLAFISYTLPGGFSLPGIGLADWFKKLVSMAFVVPVFLFFMYLIIKFLRVIDVSQIVGNGQFTTTQVIMATCIPLAFIVILLLRAKETAVSMSGEVAKYAMQGASFVGGLAVGAATGGAAWAGRNTVGRVAALASESTSLKDAAAQKGITGFVARRALNLSNNVSNSSFDARNVKVAGKDIASATGFSVGKVESEGYKKDQAKKIKEELDKARSLEAGQREKATLTSLQNEQRRLDNIQNGDIDPRTGRPVTQAQKDAAKSAAKKEDDRIKELNRKRRQGYADVAEQGDGIDYVFNRAGKVFSSVGNLISNTTAQLQSDVLRAEQNLQAQTAELTRMTGPGATNPRTGQPVTQQEINTQTRNVRDSEIALGVARTNVTNRNRGSVTTNQEAAAAQIRTGTPAAPTDQTQATNALNQTIAALTAQLANQQTGQAPTSTQTAPAPTPQQNTNQQQAPGLNLIQPTGPIQRGNQNNPPTNP